ncbi:Canalicular multispecific organic anion transporter 2, partial [Actinomortierella ambigua]
MLLAWTVGLFVNHAEHRLSTRSSDYLFVYYPISILGTLCVIATYALIYNYPDLPGHTLPLFRWLGAAVLFNLVGFIVEALPRHQTQVQQQAREKEHQTIRDQANLFSWITFHFLNDLLQLGASRPLTQEDVPAVTPDHMKAHASSTNIGHAWDKAVARRVAIAAAVSSKTGEQPAVQYPSLMWTIFDYGKWRAVAMLTTRTIGLGLSYLLPELLGMLLRFVQETSEADKYPDRFPDGGPPFRWGILLAFGMLVASILSVINLAFSLHFTMEFGMEVRSALLHMVYLKSLVLSPEARQANTVGSIVNRMSVDADKWVNSFQLIPWLILTPYELFLGLWLLYKTLGISIVAGFAVIALLSPIQGKMGSVMITLEDEKMEKMDNRVRMMNEILSGIKVIKLYGWEDSFRKKVEKIRNSELASLRIIALLRSFIEVTFSSASLFMSLASFAMYSMVGGPGWTPGKMTADVAFVSIALFGMVNAPLGMISHCISCYISVKVSTDRIQELLVADEIDPTTVQHYSKQVPTPNNPTPAAIEMKNATMSWVKPSSDKEKKSASVEASDDETQPLLAAADDAKKKKTNKPTLSNINLTFPQGSLSAVVGRVGQGKSSLLSAMIGEMYKLEGSITLYGSVAYVPQQAWIIHGTLRDNILFGQPFDQAKYDRIIYASGLRPDLAMLPAGDQTEIGERGINLSGGQKQRVSIARAAYQESDIYMFDDPLSAVDAHVDQHLWEHLLGPEGLLKDKTRILVTHGIHHLEHVDQVILLKDGVVSEVGQYADLMSHRKAFYQLIKDYSVERKTKKHKTKKQLDGATVAAKDGNESDGSAETSSSDDTKLEPKSPQPIEEEKKGDNGSGGDAAGALTSEESMSIGVVGWPLYVSYARSAGFLNVVMSITLYSLAQLCHVGTNLWLKKWIGDVQDDEDAGVVTHTPVYYLSYYAVLVALFVTIDIVVHYVTAILASLRASTFLHERLLNRVLRLPMSFFDTTPLGRIVNRFSTDINHVDENLPIEFNDFFQLFTILAGSVFVISMSTPEFLIGVPPAFLAYTVMQSYFIKTSGSLKKLYHVSKSPLYSHFAETLTGVSSIRVMAGARERFIAINENRTDTLLNMFLPYIMVNRWLQIRLESLGAFMVFAAAIAAVWNARTLDPSMVGLALSYAMNMTRLLNYMVRTVSEIQNAMVSVERLDEYAVVPTEAPAETGVVLPEKWPHKGQIQFVDYSTRYRLGLDLVVKHISFE